jgi:signal transduction histidine kinase/ActR/RegA family two-component response regulator
MDELTPSDKNRFNLSQMDAQTFACLIQSIQQLMTARRMSDIALIISKAARQLVNADGATFVLAQGDTVHYADEDAIGPLWKGQNFDARSCLSGLAIINKTQIVLEDIYADNRVAHYFYRATFVKGVMMTPVRKQDPIAAIGTYWQRKYKASQQEQDLMQVLADSAALAIETVTVLSNLDERLQDQTTELQEAREKTIELSQIKSTFISNISHDMRTPLSGLISVAELLFDSPLDDEQRKLMEILHASAAGLLNLLNDVHDLTKIEAGRIQLENIPVNLMYLVQDAGRTMAVSAFAKSLALKVNLDYRLPELVLSDSLRLREIFSNLLSNAIKFTQDGEITISAVLVNETETNAVIKFEVSDTGIGMSDEQMKHLFIPFVQTDRPISQTTRLGLPITKRLVELMGGSISVRSNLNQGSIFSISIPFNKVAAVNATESKSEEKRVESIEGVRVLLAEDNPAMQKLTLMQLQKLGTEAAVVSNGQEALEALAKNDFQVVILDCNMPVMDGFEASSQIRKIEETTKRHIPIIALTAAATTADVEKCFSSGMDVHLAKPISMPTLQAAIYALVKTKSKN